MSRLLLDAHTHTEKRARDPGNPHTHPKRSARTHSQRHINLLGRKSGRLPGTAKNLVGKKKGGGGGGVENGWIRDRRKRGKQKEE